jgi:hypothetical protein
MKTQHVSSLRLDPPHLAALEWLSKRQRPDKPNGLSYNETIRIALLEQYAALSRRQNQAMVPRRIK